MIDQIRGSVVRVGADFAVVDVGPVAVRVVCSPTLIATLRVGSEVIIFTSFVVREDGWTMFGFADADEVDTFNLVQTVSGIGPRIALAAVGTLGSDGVARAIAGEDIDALVSVPGIGRKGASRLILELKGKLITPETSAGPASRSTGWQADVEAALVSLGYSTKEATQAVARVDPSDTSDLAHLIKLALAQAGRS